MPLILYRNGSRIKVIEIVDAGISFPYLQLLKRTAMQVVCRKQVATLFFGRKTLVKRHNLLCMKYEGMLNSTQF
jgi:hypothetical protein